MANPLKDVAAHSADYFGDTREHWWNADYIAMVARRWQLDDVRAVLDVGCGVGHWGRVLGTVLPREATVVGVDREAAWVAEAGRRAAVAGFGDRFSYREGAVEALPFPDAHFDMVTCQTVLMHLARPECGLAEMVRVLRPGGLVLVAEPTNATYALVEGVVLGDPPEVMAELWRFELLCTRGKAALGEGNSHIGEALPALLAGAGLRDVALRVNDRASPMLPPYASPEERAFVEEAQDRARRNIWFWDRVQTQRYFLAGGGRAEEFELLWAAAMAQARRTVEAIEAGRYVCAGGSLSYLAWGWKA